MKPQQRVLQIDGVANFRDLGGYHTPEGKTVRWGKVYRSAQLDRLSEQGIADMASLGIKAVVDLRFSDETDRYPTIKAAVPEAEILSWHDEFQDDSFARSDAMKRSWRDSLESQDPVKVREAMRVNYPQKLYSHRAIYKKMLLRLSQGQMPLVFHCAAGKDRTGVAAALILSLLGVSDQQIVEDYLLTQQEIHHLVDTWLAGGASDNENYQDFQQRLASLPREVVQPVFDADEAYIDTLLEYVAKTYGGFKAYSSGVLGLTDTDIEQLKSQLLDD